MRRVMKGVTSAIFFWIDEMTSPLSKEECKLQLAALLTQAETFAPESLRNPIFVPPI